MLYLWSVTWCLFELCACNKTEFEQHMCIIKIKHSVAFSLQWHSVAEWSRELLLESWIQDPVACCNKCGVISPKIGLASIQCSTVELNNSTTTGRSSLSSVMVKFPTFYSHIKNFTCQIFVCFCIFYLLYATFLLLPQKRFIQVNSTCFVDYT